nr:hypothetical protein [Brucella daejeonensis]
MEVDSTSVQKTPEPSILDLARKANGTSTTIYALLGICRAAAEFADDQEGYLLAKEVPANLSATLKLATELTLDISEFIERVIVAEGKKC